MIEYLAKEKYDIFMQPNLWETTSLLLPTKPSHDRFEGSPDIHPRIRMLWATFALIPPE